MTTTKSYTLADARHDHPLWFERGAMRFFETRIHEERRATTAVYVVTSEKPPYSDRTWNVRRFDSDNSDTIGPPITDGYGSHPAALEAAGLLAEAERSGRVSRRGRDARFAPCQTCIAHGKEYPSWGTFVYSAPGEDEPFNVCDAHLWEVVRS